MTAIDEAAKVIATAQHTLIKAAVHEAIIEALEQLANQPVVCTKAETAQLLQVSEKTVARWIADGVLPTMPHTARVLVPRVAIEKFADDAARPTAVRRAS